MLTNGKIKKQLNRHGLHIWQLCKALEISRNKYYRWCHADFKGHKVVIRTAIRDLIRGLSHAN